MSKRPNLNNRLDSRTFKEFYYLKEELMDFCRKNDLQTTGSKSELTNKIACFLDTGKRTHQTHAVRKAKIRNEITLDTIIEENVVCTQKHRAFYREQLGNHFSFNVTFQKWLKNHAGKTYRDSVAAYHQIAEDKKKNKTTIAKQFEYNSYIRDFFADNKDKNLAQAIQCWKYKKSLKGHNRYEISDLEILKR